MKKEPFIITIQQYDRKYSIELEHSDVSMEDLYDIYRRITIAVGFHEDTVNEYFGDD